MTGPVDISHLKEALLILATAGVVVPIMHRFKISPILGYLAAGALLGPNGLGQFVPALPWLSVVTVASVDGISGIAEFGVVFLLFVIGLELSLERLSIMRRWVFGVGGMQVLVTTALLAALIARAGLGASASIVIASCLALSSTAIVVEMLAGTKRLASTTGRVTFAVLLMQDLAVVPILFVAGALADPSDAGLASGLALAFGQAIAVIAIIVVVGRLVLAPLFRVVAGTNSPELFMATTLLVVLGTAVATASVGLSMALGGFVAGLLLAETEFRRAIETAIDPFKGLLLGVFFFSVGMSVNPAVIADHPIAILGFAISLLAIKGLVMLSVARAFRLPWPSAIETAFLIGPGGEFAFIVIGMAITSGLIQADVGATILAVVSGTMIILPFYGQLGRRIARRFEKARKLDAEMLVAPPEDHARRAIVVGYGRVGEVVTTLLDTHGQPYHVVDRDPSTVTLARRRGRQVYYGDATDPQFLLRLGIEEATAIIVTVQGYAIADRVVAAARALRPDVPIVARARDAAHATHLYELGVADAVPETIEASLQLSEAALVNLGVAMGPVIASIHEKRDEVRQMLRKAKAGSGG